MGRQTRYGFQSAPALALSSALSPPLAPSRPLSPLTHARTRMYARRQFEKKLEIRIRDDYIAAIVELPFYRCNNLGAPAPEPLAA